MGDYDRQELRDTLYALVDILMEGLEATEKKKKTRIGKVGDKLKTTANSGLWGQQDIYAWSYLNNHPEEMKHLCFILPADTVATVVGVWEDFDDDGPAYLVKTDDGRICELSSDDHFRFLKKK